MPGMKPTSRLRRVVLTDVAILSLATFAVVAGTNSLAHPASAASTLAVTGYAESGGATTSAEIDASAPAMATVGVDGININSAGTSVSAPDSSTTSLLSKAHADNLRGEILVGNFSDSLGDFDPTALDKLVSSSSNINKVVSSLVSDVNSQGWDGVTVDFESIQSKDATGLVNFVSALKSALPSGKTVSVDVTAFPNASDYPANGYNLTGLGNAADRIALMGYDEHGPTWNGVGPIGGLPWQESCLQQILADVAASKVDLGVAGYGYTWPKSGTGDQVTDAQARQMVQSDGSTATWDSTQGEWTVTLKNGTVMWWSDAKSWPLRVSLAQKYGLHGMALWALDLSDPIPVTSGGGGGGGGGGTPAGALPGTWTSCAAEGASCGVSGSSVVAFGAGGNFKYATESGSTACSTGTFGDPAPGVVKNCYVETAPPGTNAWAKCASENGTCSFSGAMTVAYGAGSSFAYSTANGGTSCSNSVFGDPDNGVAKSCYVIGGPPSSATWTSCSAENGSCSFSGTHEVAYGANGQYFYGSFSGGTSCNNSVFGDPASGVVKNCYVQ